MALGCNKKKSPKALWAMGQFSLQRAAFGQGRGLGCTGD